MMPSAVKPTVFYLNSREGDPTFNWGEADREALLRLAGPGVTVEFLPENPFGRR